MESGLNQMNSYFRKHPAGIILVLGASLVLLSFLSESLGNGSICLFYNLTGIPCPSCGMTRAYLQLSQGNYAEAFRYHPLFLLVPVLFYGIMKDKRRIIHGLGIIFLLVWIIRMILYFPHVEPMNYNPRSLWGIIIHLLRTVTS